MNINLLKISITDQEQNKYFDYLIYPSFQGVHRLYILSLENRTRYYIQKVEIKDCNVITDRRNSFDQPLKIDLKTYDNIRNIATGQGDDYTTSTLLEYPYFKEH